jgi:PIN domain nuclease of toxin-antitoxin system
MKFLLDTHFVLASCGRSSQFSFRVTANYFWKKVIKDLSVWPACGNRIKARLGKLDPGVPLGDMASILLDGELSILPIDIPHVITAAEPEHKRAIRSTGCCWRSAWSRDCSW